MLVARDVSDSNIFGRLAITYIKAIPDGNYLSLEKIKVGEYKHYFFDLQDGATNLAIKIQENTVSDHKLILYFLQPDGNLYNNSNIEGGTSAVIEKPQSGRWEAIVEDQEQLASGASDETAYNISMWANVPQGNFISLLSNDQYIINIYPKKLSADDAFTVTVRDKKTFLPVKGEIIINGVSYSLQEGKATFNYAGDGEDVNIRFGMTTF
jgi:hypothetical protein